jgi:DNA-binding transcriptional LysR family regulator
MDLSLLRAFAAFAEHGSLTSAARALHVSQPTLHGQLARLAEELGAPLYRRVGRGVEITPEGVRVLAFARETERRVADLRAELSGQGEREPVVLAAGQGAFLHLLGPAIRRFHASGAAPLRLLTRAGGDAVEAVRRGDAHLAVVAVPHVPDGLTSDVVAKIGARVLLPRRHPLARKRSLRLHDLDGERLIVPPPGAPHRETIARALEAAGVTWQLAVEAQGWDLFAHFTRLGLGIAIVNAFPHAPAGVYARPLRDLPSVTYRLLRRPQPLSPAAQALRELVLRG